jgi:hypothetical protein
MAADLEKAGDQAPAQRYPASIASSTCTVKTCRKI